MGTVGACEILYKENPDPRKFYKYFASLDSDCKDTGYIIAKTWEHIQENALSKGILYLSLLGNKNFKLLSRCTDYDRKIFKFNLTDPGLLFDYIIFFKNHWINGIISDDDVNVCDLFKESAYEKIVLLRIIKCINEPLLFRQKINTKLLNEQINSLHNSDNDDFWSFVIEEIKYIFNSVIFCLNYAVEANELEMIHYAASSDLLQFVSHYVDVHKHRKDVEKYFLNIMSAKTNCKEDLNDIFETLSCYNILADYLRIILPGTVKLSNVNESIVELQQQLTNIKQPTVQIDLLEVMFATLFLKKSDWQISDAQHNPDASETYLFNQKEVRLILYLLKPVTEQLSIKRVFQQGSEEFRRLDCLGKNLVDALWRLELMENLLSQPKCENALLNYMLAEPESLINICLKNGDFTRASEVLKIFNLTETYLSKDMFFSELLEELKATLKRKTKIRSISEPNEYSSTPQYVEIVEEFIQKYLMVSDPEHDKLIQHHLQTYQFLEPFLSRNLKMMNVLDIALTQTEFADDSEAVLRLAFRLERSMEQINPETQLSGFCGSLKMVLEESRTNYNWTLAEIVNDCVVPFDVDQFKKEEEFNKILVTLYNNFCESLNIEKDGVLNDAHPSHQLLLDISQHCSAEPGKIKYLHKLFNYLKAFARVLYIKGDSSELVSHNKNTSYFELLTHNRSELMGQLLFERNLPPDKFEEYFEVLKLNFLYHIAGNCFPTINLHLEEDIDEDELYHENYLYPPNQAVILYILKCNRLLALILNEMYHVEGIQIDVTKAQVQYLLNYLRLPRIQHLKVLFSGSDILTVLQNDIPYRKVRDFVMEEMNRYDINASTLTNQSFEAAEEISEQGVTTVWKRLVNLIEGIPERQAKKEKRLNDLKDLLLSKLIKDAFECEYYKYIYSVSNRDIRTDLLLANLKNWPIDFCIKCVKHEITLFKQVHDKKTEELTQWLKHLQNSKMVMEVLEVTSWEKMYSLCALRPGLFISKLITAKQVDLLVEFLKMHEVSNKILLYADESLFFTAFELDTDLNSLETLLDALPLSHRISVCKRLLEISKNIEHLQFIVDYLSKHVMDVYLPNISLSLKILSNFSSNENIHSLLPLLKDPLGILEVLIMNTKLDRLDAVLKSIMPILSPRNFERHKLFVSIEKIDELLRQYAAKSLDFRVITQSTQKSSTDYASKGFVMPETVPLKENWVQNSEATECMCCMSVPFSMFNRRHHCRRCGRVVCASCSKKRMIVPNYEDIMVRVCLDCFDQTFKDQSVSMDNRSSWSVLEDFWMLTSDPDHNRIVREEFSYEFAPSVSLCLALMKFHSKSSKYIKFLLDQCEILLKLFIPNDELTREIDHLLVIRMLKSLAVAAKMATDEIGLQYGPSSVDIILNQVGLLELLAERGCLKLLPVTKNPSLFNAFSLRKLTDKLLEMEQWNLVLEIKTKAGLDNSGVFVAWGKSCLKAGCLMTARDKFSKCLDRNPYRESYFDYSDSSARKNSPLLNDIIKILESKNEAIDRDTMLYMDSQRFTGSTNTLNASTSSFLQSEGALFIINKMKNLKYISNGQYNVVNPETVYYTAPRMDPIVYDECVYYLTKYGNVTSLLDFHLKYKQYQKALEYIVEGQLSHDFFNHVYIKCLKEGTVVLLQTHMSEIDSSLNIWQNYLRKICLYLEKQRFLNCLYQLQQYMGDYVRAAMTCVRFYEQDASSFSDLTKNIGFLVKSEEHLKQTLEQDQWVNVSTVEITKSMMSFEEKSISNPSLIKKMSVKEIEKGIETIKLQNDAVQFLAGCEGKGVRPMQLYRDIYSNLENIPKETLKIPTLFGSNDDKKYIAVLCIVCGETIQDGFPLALQIITALKIKPAKVYNEAGKYLAQMEKFGSISELLNSIKQAGPLSDETTVAEMCDEMLIHAVATLTKARASKGNVDALIKFISNSAVKISAYIEAKQLKTAYYLATRDKRIVDLRRIMKEAEMLNQTDIRNLCQKAIKVHTQAASVNTPPK